MYEAMPQPAISPDIIESLFAIAMGFAVAGLCASGYRLFGEYVSRASACSKSDR